MNITVRIQGVIAMVILGVIGAFVFLAFLLGCWFFFSDSAAQAQLYAEGAGIIGAVINVFIFLLMLSFLGSPILLWGMRKQYSYAYARLVSGVDARALDSKNIESVRDTNNIEKWQGK
jgi:uncharacterized membrane protein YeaQ/YmgE (transglycosylase-associated protein family)